MDSDFSCLFMESEFDPQSDDILIINGSDDDNSQICGNSLQSNTTMVQDYTLFYENNNINNQLRMNGYGLLNNAPNSSHLENILFSSSSISKCTDEELLFDNHDFWNSSQNTSVYQDSFIFSDLLEYPNNDKERDDMDQNTNLGADFLTNSLGNKDENQNQKHENLIETNQLKIGGEYIPSKDEFVEHLQFLDTRIDDYIIDHIMCIGKLIKSGCIDATTLSSIIKSRSNVLSDMEKESHKLLRFFNESGNMDSSKNKKKIGNGKKNQKQVDGNNDKVEENTKFLEKKISETKSGIQYIKILETIMNLIKSQKYVRRRDVYYRNINIFPSQKQVDKVCTDLEGFFQVSSFDLRIVASPTGLMAGGVEILTKNGQTINYKLDMHQGMLIVDANTISTIRLHPSVKYILVVEKDTVFYSLLQSFSNTDEYLLITGKGYPSHNTRHFLCLLNKFCKLQNQNPTSIVNCKWFVLTDNDPHGAHIFKIYYESIISTKFCTKLIKDDNLPLIWLGLHTSDRSRYRNLISPEKAIKLNRVGRNKAVSLIKEWSTNDFGIKTDTLGLSFEDVNNGGFMSNGYSSDIQRNKDFRKKKWRIEMSKLLMLGKKAELEILTDSKSKNTLANFIVDKVSEPNLWL
ncbi:hypothetical protein BB559_005925 [Furculomyces boomerangus]|uniref:DNA topoisomerase (ATP-hydrolyzing) n=1 Tax=Furculomyces boomerangus TaxID=61424 RepID=A0A2T9Y5W1_9FUNG|nr:hypothetical protein BB559_005925 [Furculomyces boomerangus]